jgi:hypothetical protein
MKWDPRPAEIDAFAPYVDEISAEKYEVQVATATESCRSAS